MKLFKILLVVSFIFTITNVLFAKKEVKKFPIDMSILGNRKLLKNEVLVIYSKGNIKKNKASDWSKLGTGEVLGVADSVVTDSNSEIELIFAEGTILHVMENSVLNIQNIKVNSNNIIEKIELEIEIGNFVFDMPKYKNINIFDIKTKYAILSNINAKFCVQETDAKTVVAVFDRSVLVGNVLVDNIKKNVKIKLKKGKETTVVKNGTPTPAARYRNDFIIYKDVLRAINDRLKYTDVRDIVVKSKMPKQKKTVVKKKQNNIVKEKKINKQKTKKIEQKVFTFDEDDIKPSEMPEDIKIDLDKEQLYDRRQRRL